jgi:hypothetical protein
MRRLPKFCGNVFVVVLLMSVAAPALAGETKGKIKKVEADKFAFVLETDTGKTMTFMMDEDAQVLINDKQATLSDLRPGDVVRIASRQDGNQWMAIEVRCRRE